VSIVTVGLIGTSVLASGATTPAWTPQKTPTPGTATDFYFNGVSCPSLTACTAVGNYSVNFTSGGTLVEAWDGTRWRVQRTPPLAANLNGVSCTSTTACTAVG
jgi:hypothetical protein